LDFIQVSELPLPSLLFVIISWLLFWRRLALNS